MLEATYVFSVAVTPFNVSRTSSRPLKNREEEESND